MRQPTTQTVYDLFNGRIQFKVPVYQRAYVWNEEENWSLLWDDIAEAVRRYMEDPHDREGLMHFLGPLVLEQQSTPPGNVDPRLVIDGQQRLTTLQIILAAARNVADEMGVDDVQAELTELIFNHGRAAQGDLRFKLWPSRRDRDAFLGVIEGVGVPNAPDGIPGAWHYFRQQIRDWVSNEESDDASSPTERMRALKVALDALLYFVAINLDENDNAQVIFETLNARGTGLGALDLVKNATFLQAEREDARVEALNDNYWEPTFEADDYWLEETRQGRERRPRADWFLMHWLAAELGKVVRSDKLFDTFRREVLRPADAESMQDLVPRVCGDAKIMRSFDNFPVGSPEELFFARLQALDTTTMLPVALLLFRTPQLDPRRRQRALSALESWLVRRAILRLTSANYNRTLASLIKRIKEHLQVADDQIVAELRSSTATTAIWPTDERLRLRLEETETYGYLGQPRIRMLLEACELDVRDPAKTEPIPIPGGLSIEHALPVAWEENWPLPTDGDPERLRKERDVHVHRLGNLTLITQPLNSALSNAPWLATSLTGKSKRQELRNRSVLLINQRLCENEEWNETLIDARGHDLTERILRTWPGPDSPQWTSEIENPSVSQEETSMLKAPNP